MWDVCGGRTVYLNLQRAGHLLCEKGEVLRRTRMLQLVPGDVLTYFLRGSARSPGIGWWCLPRSSKLVTK